MKKPKILEATIENAVVKYAKARGFQARKMNGLGFRSWPDRLFIGNDCSFWVEFKRPGATTTSAQDHQLEVLRNMGQHVYVVDDVSAGQCLVNSYIFQQVKV